MRLRIGYSSKCPCTTNRKNDKRKTNEGDHYLKVARRRNSKAGLKLYRKSRNYVTYAIRKSKAN